MCHICRIFVSPKKINQKQSNEYRCSYSSQHDNFVSKFLGTLFYSSIFFQVITLSLGEYVIPQSIWTSH